MTQPVGSYLRDIPGYISILLIVIITFFSGYILMMNVCSAIDSLDDTSETYGAKP